MRELATSRVLICNDDGIDAPGLSVLEEIVRPLVRELWIVAPHAEQSAASHSITMRRPLFIRQVAEQRFTVDGTPVDCIAVAVHRLMVGAAPDLVLSGINRGGNMGEDAIYSGTVAAAMEGALLGVPSLALSLFYTCRETVRWASAAHWAGELLRWLQAARWAPAGPLNVNFPNVDRKEVVGIEITRQGHRKIANAVAEYRTPRGDTCYWIGHERDEDQTEVGTDVEAVHRGAVSVTPLRVDLSDDRTAAALKAVL